jgi:hypothetical protein
MTATPWGIIEQTMGNLMKRLALILFAGSVVLGCSERRPPHQPVHGRVTNKGEPVSKAVIIFQNEAAGIALMAELGEDGSYTVGTHKTTGLPPGTYGIAVKPAAQPWDPSSALPPPTTAAPGASSELTHRLIPPKFFSAKTSGLKAEVKQGEEGTFDFDLGK